MLHYGINEKYGTMKLYEIKIQYFTNRYETKVN